MVLYFQECPSSFKRKSHHDQAANVLVVLFRVQEGHEALINE